MPARSENDSRRLVIRNQVEETAQGFRVTDPCLARQVDKGCGGDHSKLLSIIDRFFSGK